MGVIVLKEEDERITKKILENEDLIQELTDKFGNNIEDRLKTGLEFSFAGNKNSDEFHDFIEIWNYAAKILYETGTKMLVSEDAIKTMRITKNNYVYTSDNPDTIIVGINTITDEPLFKQIFSGIDEAIRNKFSPKSYEIIAQRIGEEPKDMVFVSDNINEVKAAKEAGYGKVYFIDREGKTKDVDGIKYITDLMHML